MKGIPGLCDHCDRPALSYVGYWDGGAPGVGEWHSSARCDYHFGDPPGSFPGRCWYCGLPCTTDHDGTLTFATKADDGPEQIDWIANFHPHCPVMSWDGPRTCGRCEHPIAYGQRRIEHVQRWPGGRTLYSHEVCPR